MHPRSHRLPGAVTLALALCASLGAPGCGRVRALFEARQRSYVDVPTTLAAVKARRAQGDRVYLRWSDETWSEFGVPPPPPTAARGPSLPDPGTMMRGALVLTELCVIGGCAVLPLLPVLYLAESLRERRQEAAVHRDGKAVYYGVFDERGRFLYARAREGNVMRDIGRLPLRELGQEPIVEIARMPSLRDGGVGAPVRSRIVPQADLLRQYRDALGRQRDPEKRAKLVIEALRWLGDEALPLATERAADDAEAAAVLAAVCHDRATPPRAAVRPSLAFAHAPLMTAVASHPGVATARMALTCDPPAAALEALRAALRDDVCSGADGARSLDAAAQSLREPAPRLAWAASARCRGPRAPMLDALARRPVTAEALIDALEREGSPAMRRAVLTRLDPASAPHRAALFRFAPRHPSALVELAASTVVPTAAEAPSVVDAFAAVEFRSLRDIASGQGREELDLIAQRHGGAGEILGQHIARVAAIEVLSRAAGDEAARAAGLAAVDAVERAGGIADRSFTVTPLRLALGSVAAVDHLVMIAADLECPWSDGVPDFRGRSLRCVYPYAFWSRGCSRGDFERVHAAIAQRSAPPACGDRPPWPRPAVAVARWGSAGWP